APPQSEAGLRVSTVEGVVTLGDGGSTKRLGVGERFDVSPDGEVRIAAPRGAALALGNDIDLRLNAETSLALSAKRPTHPRFELEQGRVELDVKGPRGDRKVVVDTPDARVTVRGTRFAVDVRPRPS